MLSHCRPLKGFTAPFAAQRDARPACSADMHCRASCPNFIPPQEADIEEPAARDMLQSYQSVELRVEGVPQPVRTSYVGPESRHTANGAASQGQPVLLIHGFDSSAVEWRRVFAKLAQSSDTYALDVLGCVCGCWCTTSVARRLVFATSTS